MAVDPSFTQPSSKTQPRAGYTLPVFACAAAIAALQRLQTSEAPTSVQLDLIEPATVAEIPIEQVAPLPDGSVLAIARSDPGDNLDLTRHTPIWAVVAWGLPNQTEAVQLEGGEGVGRQTQADDRAAIYAYAERLIKTNLTQRLQPDQTVRVTIILPQGRSLAQRTSNAAFGVVEGLSLLGTSGISQPLSAPGQLEAYRSDLQQKASQHDTLVFCIGENGLDLATQLGVSPTQQVKTANWMGPLLVEAGLQGVKSILLFGYHGKLLKLAGGIFHTHHHVADARQEILTAYAATAGLPTPELQQILASPTAEAALQYLRQLEQTTGEPWVERVYGAIAHQIDQRAAAYIHNHSDRSITVGTVLFDRDRQILIASPLGTTLMYKIC